MNYDLNDNNIIVEFLNKLLTDEENNLYAPSIIKFFIITRNYGLDNAAEYIDRIINKGNFNKIVFDAIQKGFQKDNIEFDNSNLIDFITENYFENGFYFHSFPKIYIDSIEQNGLLANKRNTNDAMYYQIIKKYHFGQYFEKSENRICVSEMLDNNSTKEYAIYTPEWLELFLKMGTDEIHEAFERGNLKEMMEKGDEALITIQQSMKKDPNYDENDYLFLKQYISDIIYKRFINGNNHVGICLIPRKNAIEYFEPINYNNGKVLLKQIATKNGLSKDEIINFMLNNLSSGERTTNKNIPRELFKIVSYDIPQKLLENERKY